ncbi:hypothetical protein ES703_111260 [subsurface metagenome]
MALYLCRGHNSAVFSSMVGRPGPGRDSWSTYINSNRSEINTTHTNWNIALFKLWLDNKRLDKLKMLTACPLASSINGPVVDYDRCRSRADWQIP